MSIVMQAALSSVGRSLAVPALATIRMGSTNAFRVLFCDDTAFASGAQFTTQELQSDPNIEVVGDCQRALNACCRTRDATIPCPFAQVVTCSKDELPRCLPSADIAVPLGAKLTRDLISASR